MPIRAISGLKTTAINAKNLASDIRGTLRLYRRKRKVLKKFKSLKKDINKRLKSFKKVPKKPDTFSSRLRKAAKRTSSNIGRRISSFKQSRSGSKTSTRFKGLF